MVNTSVVLGCHSDNSKTKKQDPDHKKVTLHQFPKNENRKAFGKLNKKASVFCQRIMS